MKLQTTEALLRNGRRGTYVPSLNFKTRHFAVYWGRSHVAVVSSLWHCGIVTAKLPVGLSEFYPNRGSTDSPLICWNLELPSVAVLQNQMISVNSKSSSNASKANALMLFFSHRQTNNKYSLSTLLQVCSQNYKEMNRQKLYLTWCQFNFPWK